MARPFSAVKQTYAVPFPVPAFLLGVLPLKMSDVIGAALVAVALFGSGYDMVHASATLSFNSGEFLRGFAIAALGCGHGLAVMKLGRISRQ